MTGPFTDRRSAGVALALAMRRYRDTDAVILGLPRGGVPVAAEVALALNLPLDIILVRKVGVPGQPELALAAIAGPDGATLVPNDDVARQIGADAAQIERLAAPEKAELARRRLLWLGDRAPVSVVGKTAILVDDGMATGATMRAAISVVRAEGAARVVVAVPVAAPDTVAAVRKLADDVVCLLEPWHFQAVGVHYASFPQVADADVSTILCAAASRRENGQAV